MFLQNLIGKTIYSTDGKAVGYSFAPVFSADRKRLTGLLCADGDEREFFFPVSGRHESDRLILSRPAKQRGAVYSPLSCPVYQTDGKRLGFLQDVLLENGKVKELRLPDRTLSVEQVRAFGDCILIGKKRKPRKCQKPDTGIVLLGKSVRFDVADKNGEVLIAKGTVITPKVLQTAFHHRKLLELTAKTLCVQNP